MATDFNRWLLSDNSYEYRFNPVYKGYAADDVKMSSKQRVPTGKRYEYSFGSYKQWTMQILYVNSSDANQLNEWHKNSTILYVAPGYTTAISTVAIEKSPGRVPIEPYEDQFLIKLVLGEVL